jgi:hypothetical protein
MSPAVRIPTPFASCVVLSLCITLFLICPSGCSSGDSPPGSGTSPNSPTSPNVQQTGQPGRFNDRVIAVITAADTSGDIYVGGDFTTYNNRPVGPVVRLRPDGSLNETFTLAAEIAPTRFGVVALAPVDDGSGDIYVGFVTNIGLEPPSRVVRIWKVNPNGSVDRSFPPGEVKYSLAMTIFNTNIHTIVSVGDGSGRAYVCGVFDRYNGVAVSHIVRVTPSGTLDETFQSAADPTFTVIPSDDGSGDLYVMNWTLFDIGSPSNGSTDVYRLNADGSVDPAFTRRTTLPFGTLHAVLPVEDGSGDLFIGGANIVNETSPATSPSNNPSAFSSLLRVNPDGTLDQTSPRPAVNDFVSLMVRAVDGTRDLLISSQRVMRFKADSSVDPNFMAGTVNGQIRTLLPLPDGTGDIYGGGSFTTYNGVSVGNLVRLNANGTLDGR